MLFYTRTYGRSSTVLIVWRNRLLKHKPTTAAPSQVMLFVQQLQEQHCHAGLWAFAAKNAELLEGESPSLRSPRQTASLAGKNFHQRHL